MTRGPHLGEASNFLNYNCPPLRIFFVFLIRTGLDSDLFSGCTGRLRTGFAEGGRILISLLSVLGNIEQTADPTERTLHLRKIVDWAS